MLIPSVSGSRRVTGTRGAHNLWAVPILRSFAADSKARERRLDRPTGTAKPNLLEGKHTAGRSSAAPWLSARRERPVLPNRRLERGGVLYAGAANHERRTRHLRGRAGTTPGGG